MSGIPSWARVGAKVAYIGQPMTNNPGASWLPHPAVGAVCTITDVRDERHIYGERWGIKAIYVRVDEAVGVRRLDCFRPLVSIEDDIDTHFETLLHVPQLEDAQ